MNTLYSFEFAQHTLITRNYSEYSTSQSTTIIDADRFRQLLPILTLGQMLEYNKTSFSVIETPDDIRITIFNMQKNSAVSRRNFNELHKRVNIIRIIIKKNSNNFYVYTKSFNKRKWSNVLRQNVLNIDVVNRMASYLSNAIHHNDILLTDTDSIYEKKKLKDVLCDTLGTPVDVREYLFGSSISELIYVTVLNWFCRKNDIIIKYHDLYKLMAYRYITKKDLKKYNNNFYDAILGFYGLLYSEKHPALTVINNDNIASLQTVAVYEKIFPLENKDFNYLTLVPVESFTFDQTNLIKMTSLKMHTHRLFYGYKKEYGEFLNFLYENRQDFNNSNVKNNIMMLPNLIFSMAKLYKIGIILDTSFVPTLINDNILLHDFHADVDYLYANMDRFTFLTGSPKYKKLIEKSFTVGGVKWAIKLNSVYNFGLFSRMIPSDSYDNLLQFNLVSIGKTIPFIVANDKCLDSLRFFYNNNDLDEFYSSLENCFVVNKKRFIPFARRGGAKNIIRMHDVQLIDSMVEKFHTNLDKYSCTINILYPILKRILKRRKINKYIKQFKNEG